MIWEGKPGSLSPYRVVLPCGKLEFTSCRSLKYLTLQRNRLGSRESIPYQRFSLYLTLEYSYTFHLHYSLFSPLLTQSLHLCFYKYVTAITHTSFFKLVLGSYIPKVHGSKHNGQVRRVGLATDHFFKNIANELSSVDVLIIGAGPTGLGASKRLHQLV